MFDFLFFTSLIITIFDVNIDFNDIFYEDYDSNECNLLNIILFLQLKD